jgi:hypothetical protein
LGVEKFDVEERERDGLGWERRGVVYGMVVMGEGEGGILSVESVAVPSSSGGGKLKLTGSLGDVIRESAEIALSWVRLSLFFILCGDTVLILFFQTDGYDRSDRTPTHWVSQTRNRKIHFDSRTRSMYIFIFQLERRRRMGLVLVSLWVRFPLLFPFRFSLLNSRLRLRSR